MSELQGVLEAIKSLLEEQVGQLKKQAETTDREQEEMLRRSHIVQRAVAVPALLLTFAVIATAEDFAPLHNRYEFKGQQYRYTFAINTFAPRGAGSDWMSGRVVGLRWADLCSGEAPLRTTPGRMIAFDTVTTNPWLARVEVIHEPHPFSVFRDHKLLAEDQVIHDNDVILVAIGRREAHPFVAHPVVFFFNTVESDAKPETGRPFYGSTGAVAWQKNSLLYENSSLELVH